MSGAKAIDTDSDQAPQDDLRNQVRKAVIWRSGTQIFSQLISWASTFLVIRILAPADYGLFAMTSVVLVLLGLLNGYGLANAVIRMDKVERHTLRQLLGMLVLLNLVLAAIQIAAAPLIAAYYRQPIVADMLRVQALLYATNPFLALGYAVLSRQMDFHLQAKVNMISALVGALAALAGAFGGLGVWTLVLAPIALFTARAVGMVWVARAWMWPSFNFKGAGDIASYGLTIMAGQIFWFLQTQSDIAIAGRVLQPAELGLYTTALFLSQLFITKVVPPLNEVAFSAYARIKDDSAAVASGFLKSVRVVGLLAVPFCLGLSAVAEPAVLVALGPKYAGSAPFVQLISAASLVMTLHVLFGPAANACGHPNMTTRSAMLGAVLMPLTYLVGIRHGAIGLAWGWIVAYPVLTVISAMWIMPLLGLRWRQLGEAALPPVLAGLAMVAGVVMLDRTVAFESQLLRLICEVGLGGAIYGLWLLVFAKDRLSEVLGLAKRG